MSEAQDGKEEDQGYDETGDREPRVPIEPKLKGGAALPVPVEEEELICA